MTRAIGALALALALAACGASEPSHTTGPAAGACRVPMRFDGRVYVGVGTVEAQPTARLGLADEATCDDIGPDTRIYFPESPYQRDAWGFEDVDPHDAIGVQIGTDNDFSLLVAKSLSKERRRQIKHMLK